MRANYFLPVCMLICICACGESDPACGDAFEADPAETWFVGDFHIHATGASNDTGGDSDVQSLKNKAVERGLDFIVVTDHSNSTGSDPDTTYEDPALFNQGPEFPYWNDADQLTQEGTFLFIDGNEISPRSPDNTVATGHIGCIPMDLNSFDTSVVFTDRPMGSVAADVSLQQGLDAGCWTVVNHPYSPTKWIAFDWTSNAYDALEVWNGTLGFDGFDQYGYNAWICDLLQGKNTVAIGGSDNHRVNQAAPGVFIDPALGFPTTAVRATDLSWSSIINGLDAGDVCLFEGESRLFIDGYNKDKCREEGEGTKWIRMRGSVDANLPNAVLTLYRYKSCTDPRPSSDDFPSLDAEVLYEMPISSTNGFDVPIEIGGASGVYAAVLNGDGNHYFAFSKGIVIP